MSGRALALVAAILSPACAGKGGDSSAGRVEESGDGSDLPTLVLNEFMAANAEALVADDGSTPDWIEIYDASAEAIDLDGYTITDDLAAPGKVVLGPGLLVPAHGWLLLYADGAPDLGDDHLAFHLEKSGEEIGLYAPDGTPADEITYPAQTPDVSAARVPDGDDSDGAWTYDDTPTPGGSNEG